VVKIIYPFSKDKSNDFVFVEEGVVDDLMTLINDYFQKDFSVFSELTAKVI